MTLSFLNVLGVSDECRSVLYVCNTCLISIACVAVVSVSLETTATQAIISIENFASVGFFSFYWLVLPFREKKNFIV